MPTVTTTRNKPLKKGTCRFCGTPIHQVYEYEKWRDVAWVHTEPGDWVYCKAKRAQPLTVDSGMQVWDRR